MIFSRDWSNLLIMIISSRWLLVSRYSFSPICSSLLLLSDRSSRWYTHIGKQMGKILTEHFRGFLMDFDTSSLFLKHIMSLRSFVLSRLSQPISSYCDSLGQSILHRFLMWWSSIWYSPFSWICVSPIPRCSSSSKESERSQHYPPRLGWQSRISV